MGADKFTENLNNIGFNQQLDFPLTLRKSQYSSGDSIDGEIKLADTGYGQGDLLVNPIHVASIYSAFANGGDMVKPYIEYNNGETEIYKVINCGAQDIDSFIDSFSRQCYSTCSKTKREILYNDEWNKYCLLF